MNASHQVRRNEAFKGLPHKDCLTLESYTHFRNVQMECYKKALDDSSAPFNPKFLESINHDKPMGCWNFQTDLPKINVLGRSLTWPGFHFYHILNKNKFGSVYIGDGHKNLELQFMTQ